MASAIEWVVLFFIFFFFPFPFVVPTITSTKPRPSLLLFIKYIQRFLLSHSPGVLRTIVIILAFD